MTEGREVFDVLAMDHPPPLPPPLPSSPHLRVIQVIVKYYILQRAVTCQQLGFGFSASRWRRRR